jgi:SAM-dependent methyltransferase
MEVLAHGRGAAAAYDALAPGYDAFTAHHDYATWTAGLLGLARGYGLAGRRVLDVGCGTGKSLLPLIDTGWEGVGCDASAGMLAHAAPALRTRATLHHLDARRLPSLGAFDLVWALDDVANYMLDADELIALLRGMAANLAPGGVLLFDTNTLWTYRTFFASEVVCRDGAATMVWRGLAGRDFAAGGLAQADLDGVIHAQRHHPADVVGACIAEAGLVAVGVHGQFPDGRFEQPLDEERHNKAIHVARL